MLNKNTFFLALWKEKQKKKIKNNVKEKSLCVYVDERLKYRA